MKKRHLITFNLLLVYGLVFTAAHAQTSKKHTEKFKVNEAVSIHVNTSHTNVKFETWDKNEVEVTFILEAKEKVDELFDKWKYSASGDQDKITIKSGSGSYLDMEDFDFDFDMKDFNLNMEDLNMNLDNLNIELSNLNLDVDNMVNNIMDSLNLEDIPSSPFGKGADFNGAEYEKDPDAYLKKMNKKHGTQITRQEADQWLEEINKWSEGIEIRMEKMEEMNFNGLEKQIEEQAKEFEKSMEKWEKENGSRIKEMTKKIEEQMKDFDFEIYQQFNYFDQERSDIKKTIHIKLPKKAKLHMNIRYGEVTLAENLQNINADLNYASLSANTIKGKNTEISASYAPIFVDHWRNGQLKLNYCNDITIKEITTIDLKAQGTDIIIGTLLNSGVIHSSYGDLEIKKLGTNLKALTLELDYGSALLHLPAWALDLKFEGNQDSSLSLPKKINVISDTREGRNRVVKAYTQKPNSGQALSILANYGDLTIR